MRIGKFAESNSLSIDTIRHYMDFGLIIPEKRGGQYFFDERCQRDLKEILELKQMGFSLSEVKTLFTYKRLAKLTPYHEAGYYRDFFIDKHENLEKEIKELTLSKDKIEAKIQELSRKSSIEKSVFGIDIKFLDIFRCPECSGELILSDGTIYSNQVVNGCLSCSCGKRYFIEEGILNINRDTCEKDISIHNEYISEYINLTDETYLDRLNKGLEWSNKKLNSINLHKKVILELGSGIGFFLRSIYSELPMDCLYLAVDRSLGRHKFLKDILERSGEKRNIIFVCADFLELPIKDKSVDIVLDISGTSNYSFEHGEFLLESIDRYVKERAYLLGSYILFKNFALNSIIEEEFRINFILKNVQDNINKLKFKLIDEKTSDYLDKGGKYENYFTKGEKVFSYSYFGER